jgi:sigma-E factor negative regulatory protein RseB
LASEAGLVRRHGAQGNGLVRRQAAGGFQKITEGYRTLRGKREPVVHLVYSDGLVSISVFVESIAQPTVQTGLSQQGGLNVYATRNEDHLITVLGEAPPAAVRQIAQSVARR